LIENGCHRIAYIGGKSVSPVGDRLEGYRIALSSAKLRVPNKYTICRPHGDDSGDMTGYKAAQELLALSPRPDGIFCNNDPIATGAMGAILEAGLCVPGHIRIIGAGNVRYSGALRVPLSSVDQDNQTLRARAAELALSLVQAKSPSRPKQILLQPRLVARESTVTVEHSP
jgi:LacI family transcriptional regulator